MNDLRRISVTAVVLLVVLRVSLGWQLLYEGLWKIDTLSTPTPWTSAGYLRNSVGPMRNVFRSLAGDPDELGWLDYDTVASRWQDWSERFIRHYGLDEKQAARLNALLYGNTSEVDGKQVFAQSLAQLPTGVTDLNKAARVSASVVWFDKGRKLLLVNAERLLTPADVQRLEAVVKKPADFPADKEWSPDASQQAYLKAVNTLFERQKKSLGYLRRLAGALKGNPELVGNDDWQQVGKIEQYKQMLAEYEKEYQQASTESEWDHLQYKWGKIQSLRSELTGPIKAMEASLKEDANKLLTLDQRSRGPVPEPMTSLKLADTLTIAGLTVLGFLLIAGLFSRFAAAVAAFMLFNFYLAMPPLPGTPPIPGPEHSFIVNKNLIEVIALLALASIPTGKWFGLDALMARFIRKWKADKTLSSGRMTTVSVGDEPLENSPPVPAPAS